MALQTADRDEHFEVRPSAAITDGRVISGEAQRSIEVERWPALKSAPNNKSQRLFTRGRRLEDAMIGIAG